MQSGKQINKTMKESKYLYLIDAGHGGLIGGKYQTRGKRSPKFDNGFVLYEGVNNRDNARLIMDEMKKENIRFHYLTDTNDDISLAERVSKANEISRVDKCIYLSIHSNASGSGGDWGKAKGNGVYIYTSPSRKTKAIAKVFASEIESNFEDLTKWRGIKNRNFYVLRKTNCPAVLFELGFHDHKEEAELMLTEKWKKEVVKSIINSIKIWEESKI